MVSFLQVDRLFFDFVSLMSILSSIHFKLQNLNCYI